MEIKFLDQSVRLLKDSMFSSAEKKIEYCGRNCYQSQDKITNSSYKDFILNAIDNEHYTILEHYSISISFNYKNFTSYFSDLQYFSITCLQDKILLSGSIRAFYDFFNQHYKNDFVQQTIIFLCHKGYELFFSKFVLYKHSLTNGYINFELSLIDSNKTFLDCIADKHNRLTFEIITDRGTMTELRTHRRASFLVESTRFCDYSKKQYNSSLCFINPILNTDIETKDFISFTQNNVLNVIKDGYKVLSDIKVSAQIKRHILPNILKCSVIMTANINDLKYIYKLRSASNAHPHIQEIMRLINQEYKKYFNKSLGE